MDPLDQQPVDRAIADTEAETLSSRMARYWALQDVDLFYKILLEEASPRILRRIVEKFEVSEEDATVCLDKAVEHIWQMPAEKRQTVENPYAYMFAIAKNAAIDLLEDERECLQTAGQANRKEAPGGRLLLALDTVFFDDEVETTALLVEEILDFEPDPEDPWWTLVIRTAVGKLSPTQQAVILCLYEKDFDLRAQEFVYKSSDVSGEMGMSPEAFRKNKQRAYAALRQLIPEVIRELGLRPSRRWSEALDCFPEEHDDEADLDGSVG
jgi:DNA-directed RNA polymerase specialized sigma24 family protein